MEAFSDFIWHRMDGPPPTEAEMQSVGKWLIDADHTGGLARIIWHNCDHNTLDMVLHTSGLQYAHIPVAIIGVVPVDMNAYILMHLTNPDDLAHKFLDVTGDEFKGTGLDAYDAWSPGEGDDEEGKEKVYETESDLLDLMTASLPIGDWRAKSALSFALSATAHRLMPRSKFVQEFWGNRRMESWLAALQFPTAFKEKLLRMELVPT